MDYFKLQGVWISILHDHYNHCANYIDNHIDYDKFVNIDLINQIDINRNVFIYTYSEIYKYRPYFQELISDIEMQHIKYFLKFTLNINDVTFLFLGVKYQFTTYR